MPSVDDLQSLHSDSSSDAGSDAGSDVGSDISSVESLDQQEILHERLPKTLPELFQQLHIEYEDLEFLGEGASHIVFSYIEKSDCQKYVIRVAIRDPENDIFHNLGMDDHVAVLRSLQSSGKRFGSVPHVTHFDSSINNAIGQPYMIETFITGQRFGEVLENLSEDRQSQLIDEIARTYHAQDSVTFEKAGTLCAAGDGSTEVGLFQRPGCTLNATWDNNISIGTWLKQLLANKIQEEPSFADHFGRVAQLLEEMHDMDILDNSDERQKMNKTVLQHFDLHPGNFFIAQNPETGCNEISGVIDWDYAAAVPPMLRQPAYWLWCPDSAEEDEDLVRRWNTDYDFLPRQYWNLMDDDEKAFKTKFDESMRSRSLHYMDDTYGRGLWIRRVAKFAMWGVEQTYDIAMLDWTCDEWIWHLWSQYGICSKVKPSWFDEDVRHMMPPRPPWVAAGAEDEKPTDDTVEYNTDNELSDDIPEDESTDNMDEDSIEDEAMTDMDDDFPGVFIVEDNINDKLPNTPTTTISKPSSPISPHTDSRDLPPHIPDPQPLIINIAPSPLNHATCHPILPSPPHHHFPPPPTQSTHHHRATAADPELGLITVTIHPRRSSLDIIKSGIQIPVAAIAKYFNFVCRRTKIIVVGTVRRAARFRRNKRRV
ncbi:MAG: hypothetical protein M1831_006377 [Alyxoria varia]|nr:MAG: hypothetical protein M1831_006377 [Alyxoria varia]